MLVTPAVRQETQPLQLSRHHGRRFFGRVDQLHIRAHDARDERLEQGIVRAAEYQHVYLRTPQRLQVLARDELGGGVLEPSLLDQRDEERTGLTVDARV